MAERKLVEGIMTYGLAYKPNLIPTSSFFFANHICEFILIFSYVIKRVTLNDRRKCSWSTIIHICIYVYHNYVSLQIAR